MAKKDDKKTALKLLNKYAESHSLLTDENLSLRNEIKDLKANLKINKEIIESLFTQLSTPSDKHMHYLNKLKEENAKLYQTIDKIRKEKNDLRSKLTYLEQTNMESLSREKEENEKLKTNSFLLENNIMKKESQILLMKKKLNKTSNEDDDDDCDIVIMEPNKAIVYINDELLMYKEIYDNLMNHVKDLKDNLTKYEIVITELQTENGKLKMQNKLQLIKQEEERFNKKYSKSCYPTPQVDYTYDNEDFYEILKACGFSIKEFNQMANNPMYSKLIECIELMNRQLCDKSVQIKLLTQENENLNQKNMQLNEENIIQYRKNLDLRKEILKNPKKDNSMLNNTSQIGLKTQSDYRKKISAQENGGEVTETTTKLNDSIVYNKANTSKVDFCTGNQHYNSFQSCTSSEFREGLNINGSFISKNNGEEINYLNFDIKSPNI